MTDLSKEIRIHHDSIDGLNEDLIQSFHTLSIGHTGCMYKMISLSDQSLIRISEIGKRVKIEIPVLFDAHFDWFQRNLDRWLKYSDHLVVNDWGTLSYLHEKGISSEVELSLGRKLAHSYFHSPWSVYIFQEEEAADTESWSELNLANNEMVEWLKESRINEIEIDPLPQLIPSIQYLRSSGFKINGFHGYPLVSMSRSCHTLRYFDEKKGNCQHLCNTAIQLGAKERWNRFEDVMEHISKPIREELGQFLVYGNIVVQNKQIEIENIEKEMDSWIFDSRFSPKIELKKYKNEVTIL
ncbi:hypothetical protein [Chengkuizengella axinellae]|uniref:DUF1835 domain-containing protein n=1 Tax=Chengkuizengella axinellae TaxID=3064388 RepID=A0ABT9IU13_9BACL|nr:hypothetical protein [Chengkuizengella sp. 2205SS18-9]MDP5272826.1 hypothetical protein [Chengkuizengella sp. 2205SS18-9]